MFVPIQYLAVKRETDIQKKNLVTKGKMKAKRRGEMYKKGSATETGLSRGEEDSESQTGNRAEIGKKGTMCERRREIKQWESKT